MTQGLPPKPTCLSIFGGILLAALIFAAFIMLPDLVKWAGAAFTFIPGQLGLIEVVRPSEVMPVDMSASPTAIVFGAPGKYALFTANADLLVINDAVLAAKAKPWIKLREPDGTEIAVTLVERGLALYDTPFAKGRPVARFELEKPGPYSMTHPTRKDWAYLVPDYTDGNEGSIVFWMLVQVVPLAAGVYYWRRRTRRGPGVLKIPPPSPRSRQQYVEEANKRSERPAGDAYLLDESTQPPADLEDSNASGAATSGARDVLAMVHAMDLDSQSAESELEKLMLSQVPGRASSDWGAELGLSAEERMAYGQGASVTDLVKLRYDGWPTKCAKCNGSIEPRQLKWWFTRDEHGAPGIYHVQCPPKARSG